MVVVVASAREIVLLVSCPETQNAGKIWFAVEQRQRGEREKNCW